MEVGSVLHSDWLFFKSLENSAINWKLLIKTCLGTTLSRVACQGNEKAVSAK